MPVSSSPFRIAVNSTISAQTLRDAGFLLPEDYGAVPNDSTPSVAATNTDAINTAIVDGYNDYKTVWLTGETGKPRLLLAILTPANLFTGVLGCGLFCLLNLWMDRKYLPKALRLPGWLWLLNLLAGLVFVALGLKGYWDDPSRSYAVASLCVMLVAGVGGAHWARRWIGKAE